MSFSQCRVAERLPPPAPRCRALAADSGSLPLLLRIQNRPLPDHERLPRARLVRVHPAARLSLRLRMTSGPRRALTVINAGPIRIFRMRAPATALLVSVVGFLGCGEEVRGQVHDPERVARCISARSGTLLSDPLAGRSDVRLSPALRERAAGEPRVGVRRDAVRSLPEPGPARHQRHGPRQHGGRDAKSRTARLSPPRTSPRSACASASSSASARLPPAPSPPAGS